ncbi:caspase family protein [Candidatus Uabimicrobium amorphum]|uniref:Peptidase C14 caspase domain-containing protein n=1 Tax=Uabimicrobium amorphum TaxID=2596890 RepID=A0A5S9F588_UABAM|nr:caspase family protein [Candidatus Uabimicrobium amorphum]BBM86585.1 hypothetical protein UABAM_04971 [Candidatus Uabimicrobium amorphum]
MPKQKFYILTLILSLLIACNEQQQPPKSRSTDNTSTQMPQTLDKNVQVDTAFRAYKKKLCAKSIHTFKKQKSHDFAVFIGIDDYKNKSEIQSLSGAVNDAIKMYDIFNTLDFNCALVTNSGATRGKVLDLFKELVAQIQETRNKSDERINVVIYFSGHGSQVKDVNFPIKTDIDLRDNESDEKDETWVMFDSGADGKNDIRDDEIDTLLALLLHKLKCQVTLITDACHSGSIYRNELVGRRHSRDKLSDGPAENMFADLLVNTQKHNSDNEIENGYASYSACKDNEVAWEHIDDNGLHCGRFTYVLRQILPTLRHKNPQYQDIHHLIQRKFLYNKWRSQMPKFSGSMKEKSFFGGDDDNDQQQYGVLSWKQGKSHFIDLGEVHGIHRRTLFDLYETKDDIDEGRPFKKKVRVKKVFPLRCAVELEGKNAGYAVPASAIEYRDFAIKVDKNVDTRLQEFLQKGANSGKWTIAQNSNYDYELTQNATKNTLELYPKTKENTVALSLEIGKGKLDLPRAQKLLQKNLHYLAVVKRIMSLNYESYASENKDLDFYVLPNNDETEMDSEVEITPQDTFTLRFANNSDQALYLNVFYMNVHSQLEILYPQEGEGRPLEKQSYWDLTGLKISVPKGRSFAGTHLVKVIASEDDLDFRSFLKAPQTSLDPSVQLLFDIDSKWKQDLVAGKLSPGLCKVLTKNKCAFTPAAKVEKMADRWKISENEKTLYVMESDYELYIYRERAMRSEASDSYPVFEKLFRGVKSKEEQMRARLALRDKKWATASVVIEVEGKEIKEGKEGKEIKEGKGED